MSRVPLITRRRLLGALLAAAVTFGSPLGAGTERASASGCVDITGCWNCGCWKSFCSPHHGKLRARIVRCDSCHYKCTFSGTFFTIIPFRYTATLTVTGYGDGVVYFRSSRNIPFFGGSFTMCGKATACGFTANYHSKKDRGVFRMSR